MSNHQKKGRGGTRGPYNKSKSKKNKSSQNEIVNADIAVPLTWQSIVNGLVGERVQENEGLVSVGSNDDATVSNGGNEMAVIGIIETKNDLKQFVMESRYALINLESNERKLLQELSRDILACEAAQQDIVTIAHLLRAYDIS